MGVLNLINNSTLRLITGVLIGFFVLGCVIAGGIPLMLLVMFVAFIGSKEYVDILKKKGFRPFLHLILAADICFVVLTALKRFDLVPVVLTLGTIGAFTLVLCKGRQPYIANVATTVLGFVYGGWLPCYVILLRQLNQDSLGFFTIKMCSGLGFLVLLFFTILMTDVGAYVCGSKFGKTPLAPVVSPKKTVEGAVGGSILALCTAMFIGWLIHIEWYQSLIAGFLITLFAQVGDLAESLIKRDAGVKDSGNSLPGHGGFLDRADSYLFSTPVAYFYFNYFVVSDQLTLDFISFARKALHAVGL